MAGRVDSDMLDSMGSDGARSPHMRFASINSDVELESAHDFGTTGGARLLSMPQPAVRAWTKTHSFVCTVLCILFIVGLSVIVWAVYFQSASSMVPPPDVPVVGNIDLEHFVLNSTVGPQSVLRHWSLALDVAYTLEDGDIYRLQASAKTVLLPAAQMVYNGAALDVFDFRVTPDEKRVVLFTNQQMGWRHSFSAEYYVWVAATHTITPLTGTVEALQLLELSPRTDEPTAAYVQGDRLFVVNLASGQSNIVPTDPGYTFHGIPDWSYEEEVLESNSAVYWAPDGLKLAFMSFDVSAVPNYTFPLYDGSAYPGSVDYKYPSPGYGNAVANVAVYDLQSGTLANVDMSADGAAPSSRYVVQARWASASEVAVRTLNRGQNVSTLLVASVAASPLPVAVVGEVALRQMSTAWVDVTPALTFFAHSGATYFVDLAVAGNGYNHLALYKLGRPSTLQRWITSGAWDVTALNTLSTTAPPVVVYTSAQTIAGAPSPIDRTLWSAPVFDNGAPAAMVPDSGWYSASFSSAGGSYFLSYNGPGLPLVQLYSFDGTSIPVGTQVQQTLTTNRDLHKVLSAYNIPRREMIQVPSAAGDSIMLNAYMLYPPGLDPATATSSKQYPLLMYVYGGPGSQTVTKQYPVWGSRNKWHLFLASRGFIVASVDGRGTGARGTNFLHSNYLNLGSNEVDDQLAAAEHFGRLPYVDNTRIGLWGWSFGGYMTTKTLTRGPSILRMGMAVAPVTDWRFYDSIYTERYMRTPQSNPEGYAASSVVNFAGNITQDTLLLVHGSGDDNVHFTNAMELAKQLVKHQVLFRMMVYPNQPHGLSGGGAQYHIWRLLTEQVFDKLGQPDPTVPGALASPLMP